jgi:dihydrofolate reductase
MRLVVINHISLDGVMQAPGRPDEDTRGGFSHGGWANRGNDEVMGQALAERMGKPEGGLLLGRRSYEDMLASWNAQGGPYKDALNNAPKYVASTSSATSPRLAELDARARRHPRPGGRAQAHFGR